MKFMDSVKLVNKAFEKRKEDKYFQLYAGLYPKMDEKSFIPFEKFYKPTTPQQQRQQESNKTAEEILADVRNILNSTTF